MSMFTSSSAEGALFIGDSLSCELSDGLALDERGISGAAREINSAATCHHRSRAPLSPILDHQTTLILVVICRIKIRNSVGHSYVHVLIRIGQRGQERGDVAFDHTRGIRRMDMEISKYKALSA
jgi:hypothetical protein